MITYGSVCSGIEAASVAWHSLGWQPAWLAEVDRAASDVLAYRFPHVPNLGDLTTIAARIRSGEIVAPDILVGGTPCQSFSVAGLRGGLADPRGQLTMSFIDLANAIDEERERLGLPPCIIIWENVPGVLNHKDNPLGCFLAGIAGESDELCPAGKRWTNAGAVFGPQRAAAWRVLDAQYFRLAQRRRRVFLVASAREGFDPGGVLLEFDGLRRDSAPSREKGEIAAGTLDARTDGGGFPGTDGACSGYVVPAARGRVRSAGEFERDPPGAGRVRSAAELNDTVGALDTECGFQKATMQSVNAGHDVPSIAEAPVPPCWDGRDVSQTLDAVLHKGQTMPEKNRFPAVLHPVGTYAQKGHIAESSDVTLSDPLRAKGGDCGPGSETIVAFSSKDYGADAASEPDPTLRASGHSDSHANGGSPPAVAYAFQPRIARNGRGDMGDLVNALNAQAGETGKGDAGRCVAYAIQERAVSENPDAGPDGVGVRADDCAYTLEARPVPQAVAFVQNSRDEVRLMGSDGQIVGALAAQTGAKQQCYIAQAAEPIPFDTTQITSPSNYSSPQAGDPCHPLARGAHPPAICVTGSVTHALKAEGFDASEDGTGRGQPIVPAHGTRMAVRRLLPVECERLQGFPDNWTRIPIKKYPARKVTKTRPAHRWELIDGEWWLMAADGPRYKQLGNSMPTRVMHWIGRRVDAALSMLSMGHNGGPPLDDELGVLLGSSDEFADLLGDFDLDPPSAANEDDF